MPAGSWPSYRLRPCRRDGREVIQAVLRESAAVSVSAAQNFVGGLRAFLRFCFAEGLMQVDLSGGAASDRTATVVAASGDPQGRRPGVAGLL